MQCTCCSLYTRTARWAAAAYDCMPMCIGSFSYTRSRLASLARFLFVGQSDVRLRSLLQGTRVTYVTETFLQLTTAFTYSCKSWTILLTQQLTVASRIHCPYECVTVANAAFPTTRNLDFYHFLLGNNIQEHRLKWDIRPVNLGQMHQPQRRDASFVVVGID